MCLLVPRLGEQRATAVSSPRGRGRAHVKTMTPCLPTHFLPSLQALSLPGWYLGILSQGAAWMWTSYKVGSGSRARNFSNSVMETCLRIGSLTCFTLWCGCGFSNHLSLVSLGWKKSRIHKKSQIQERSSFLYSHGVCDAWV